LLGASLLLGIINAFVRPFLLLLSIPFIIITMGFFIFVVNALLLLFVAQVIPEFHVAGFWNAFFGAMPGLLRWDLTFSPVRSDLSSLINAWIGLGK
jgi:uncharacterized membrane protein YvlD (DUF360 family)